MNQDTPTAAKKPRRTAALWGSGAIAAAVLVLGVSGTLSSWTSALITNDNNSAGATAQYLALVETDNVNTCDTTTSPNNTISACSSINKYGGNSTMSPGDSEVVDVTFTNPGTADGNTFSYTPRSCTPTNGTGGIDPCTDGDPTGPGACSTGTSYNAGNAIARLPPAA